MTLPPPRVAVLIASDGPGGAEMVVFRLAHELRARGCEVTPVLPAGGYGWLGGLLRDDGFAPVDLTLSTRWFDVASVRQLKGLFRDRRIEVVHSHEFDFAVLGTAAARLSGLPHVFTLHGGLTATTTFRRRAALRMAIRGSRRAVAVSGATRDRFAGDLGVSPDRLEVIPNGVPLTRGDAAQVRREFGCAPDDVVLLAVGTLERNKGHHVLIEALETMPRSPSSPRWKLIIAGGRGGDQQESLSAAIRERHLSDRIHIVTQRSDIADLQELADVFVMPSFIEGLPMALLEAMVAGNAIVASDTGGIPEAIAAEKHGLLVPPGDVAALSGALRRLIADRALRTRLGDAAAVRAHSEFTSPVMARRYHELYDRFRPAAV